MNNIRTLFEKTFPQEDSRFEMREEQVQLSEKISHTMNEGGVMVAEAGTGIGKSFAYLVPAIQQASQGQQVVIVTATIALQHQLANKDIPHIQTLLNTNVPVTVFKGKSNYLCKTRLESLSQNEHGILFKKEGLKEATAWAEHTETGDKEELQKFSPISMKLWREISTHEYSCGGKRCQEKGNRGCYHVHTKRKLKQSSIIITNYHLLAYHLMNMVNNENSVQSDHSQNIESILPSDAIYILDESHNIRDITRKSLAVNINAHELEQMYESLFGKQGVITLEQNMRGIVDNNLQSLLNNIRSHFQKLIAHIENIDALILPIQESLPVYQKKSEMNYDELCQQEPQLLEKFRLLHIDIRAMIDVMNTICTQFADSDVLSEIISRHEAWWERTSSLANILSEDTKPENMVRWCSGTSKEGKFTYSLAPLFVSSFLEKNFFTRVPAVICTSATLAVRNDFEFFMKKSGIPEGSSTVIFPSPFPYEKNVLFMVPQDAPSIKEGMKQYTQYLENIIPECIEITEGRALILCTSYSMVQSIARVLQPLESQSKWELLVQGGSKSPSILAEEFRNNTRSVLVATASFWEGFDAPGNTLQLLIITRLPFSTPDNLFVKEESKYLETRNLNAFYTLSLPEATLRLRQGFGRLIRSHSDKGVVLITDNRIHYTSYGQQMTESLPKCMTRTVPTHDILKEIQSFFKLIKHSEKG